MDDATALVFFEFSDHIAAKLESLLVYEEIANNILVTEVTSLLTNLVVEHNIAFAIADGIVAVIRFFTV